ncbi:right-handed parallel beta-helix repeat-containing protein [candidate division KSB1 bacterium]
MKRLYMLIGVFTLILVSIASVSAKEGSNSINNPHGKIEFLDKNINVNDYDIDKHIKINNNFVSLDSDALPELNLPAKITLHGIGYDSAPIIAQDGKICSDCELIEYKKNKVVFTVPHFTNYTTWNCVNVTDDLVIPSNTNITICQNTFNVDDSAGDGIIKINGSNIILNCDGSTIIGSGTGIGISAQGSITIEEVKDYLQGSSPSLTDIEDYAGNNIIYLNNISISDCIITGFEKGIKIDSVEGANINDIEVYSNTEGLSFFGKSSSLNGVLAYNNDVGLTVGGLDTIVNNVQTNNNTDSGIVSAGVRINISNSNSTLDGKGIISIGYNNKIFDNTVVQSTQPYAGIAIAFSSDAEVYNNTAHDNNEGIAVVDSSSSYVHDNKAYKNNKGITLGGLFSNGVGVQNQISFNEVYNNSDAGIVLSEGTLTRLIQNMFARSLGGTPSSEPRFRLNDTIVSGNYLENPSAKYDFAVVGETIVKTTVQGNTFNGRGVYFPCNAGNEMINNEFGLDNKYDFINCEPNINGTIYDEKRNPAEGVEISFYHETQYDPSLDTTNIDSLVPKAEPDTVTDSNGYYEFYLPENTVWHMVMNGSKKIDFNVFTNRTNNGKGHDSDIFENESYDPNTDFNVEGHIIHSGAYEHGNNYTCRQYVEFTMFGRNRGGSDVTITYAIENHTAGGSPTDNRHACDGVAGETNLSDIVYCSDINEVNDTLFLPADGSKYKKNFQWGIPCDWQDGKYDIHVYDNSKWGNMHKIGNFFITKDDQPPVITAFNYAAYTDDTIIMEFFAKDYPLSGTIPEILQIGIAGPDDTINVSIDKFNDESVDYIESGGWNSINLTFTQSGHYQIKWSTTDTAGNYVENVTNVSIWLTEEQAGIIGEDIIYEYGFARELDDVKEDYYYITGATSNVFDIIVDRFMPEAGYKIGFEYITPDDPDAVDMADFPLQLPYDWKAQLNQDINDCTGPEYIKPIESMTEAEFNDAMYGFMSHLKCQCSGITLPGGPPC